MSTLLNRLTIHGKTIASFTIVVLLVLALGLFAVDRLASAGDLCRQADRLSTEVNSFLTTIRAA